MTDSRSTAANAPDASFWEGSPVIAPLSRMKQLLIALFVFSGALNLLMLSGSIFMLQVYDRVLHSRSLPTLVALLVMVLAAFIAYAALEIVRSRLFMRIGEMMDVELAGSAFSLLLPSARGVQSRTTQTLRDIEQLRQFVTGPAMSSLFDLPWMPIYLFVIFILHPMLGWFTVAGMLILIVLAVVSERSTKADIAMAAQLTAHELTMSESVRRAGEAIQAMGMAGPLKRLWLDRHMRTLLTVRKATDVSARLASAGKAFRLFFQSAILALGAYLVIRTEITAGAIFAASILGARALQPIEQAVAQWRSIAQMRTTIVRLDRQLRNLEARPRPETKLPAPVSSVSIRNIAIVPPGQRKPLLPPLSLVFSAGEGVGIIGPSGCGKTSLLRTLVGLWRPAHGEVRYDGASLDQWDPDELGRHIGYLPQSVDLFDGTVAQNIARFQDAEHEAIVAAAKAAGAHDMIVGLSSGYDTWLGDNGSALSAGQRQRIGLARALFGDPFLVALDEPNAHLDSAGERALHDAIRRVCDGGGIVVVATHRPAALAALDKVLVLGEGEIKAYGPKEEVLSRTVANAPAIRAGAGRS